MNRAAPGLVHLIGSVPLASTDEVFRTLASTLGDRLSRMPDGETGERRRWIWWQRTMLERHPAMEVDRDTPPIEIRQWDGVVLRRSQLFRLRAGVDPDAVDFPTGYAEAALESWSCFDALRRAGVIAAGTRLQVCLPTPMSSAFMYVSPRSHDDYMRAYERALLRALADIVTKVPAGDLSIQWDICQEVLVFETYFASRPADYKERVFALMARLGAAVPAGVELGYHLCYGSPADQHLVMPRDTAILTEIGNAIFARARRPIDFLHLPVPRERDDVAYFEPLGELRLPATTRLYLGLIHWDDVAGDRRRIDTARRVVTDFGIASECGWGRTDPTHLPGLLESHRQAADYLSGLAR
jgi:hypothetical protein